jgi:hypothetical protein
VRIDGAAFVVALMLATLAGGLAERADRQQATAQLAIAAPARGRRA